MKQYGMIIFTVIVMLSHISIHAEQKTMSAFKQQTKQSKKLQRSKKMKELKQSKKLALPRQGDFDGIGQHPRAKGDPILIHSLRDPYFGTNI